VRRRQIKGEEGVRAGDRLKEGRERGMETD
jgi:hypothetical protein